MSDNTDRIDPFDFARGGKYGPDSAEQGPITSIAFEYAKGGSLHGLNDNPDGSPETMRQAMIREREEAAREQAARDGR